MQKNRTKIGHFSWILGRSQNLTKMRFLNVYEKVCERWCTVGSDMGQWSGAIFVKFHQKNAQKSIKNERFWSGFFACDSKINPSRLSFFACDSQMNPSRLSNFRFLPVYFVRSGIKQQGSLNAAYLAVSNQSRPRKSSILLSLPWQYDN